MTFVSCHFIGRGSLLWSKSFGHKVSIGLAKLSYSIHQCGVLYCLKDNRLLNVEPLCHFWVGISFSIRFSLLPLHVLDIVCFIQLAIIFTCR